MLPRRVPAGTYHGAMHEHPSPRAPGPRGGARGRDRQLAAQYAITRALADADDFVTVAPALLETLGIGLGWQAAAVWVVTKDSPGRRLHCAAIWTRSGLEAWRDASLRLSLEVGAGLPGRVWKTHQPAWINDLVEDDNFLRLSVARQVGLRHGVAFPVMVRGRVYAVVECFGRRIRETDAGLVAFLEAVGQQFGVFLQRMETRQALVASEARKAGVLEGAVDAIISSDEHGRILDFNPAAERLFGQLRTEALGRRIVDLLVPEDLRSAHRDGMRRYVETRIPHILGQRVRTRALRADGTTVEVELTVTEVELHGRPMFTAFIRDVTEQRQAETVRDRFLEILSHELRTPVTSIYGGARVLARPGLADSNAAELLADIGAEADRLYRLVEDLMVLARAERGATEVSLDPVHLDRLVDRLVAAARVQWPSVEFRVVSDPGAVLPVLAEESYVEQILRNLISNAAKYASGGREVEIRVEYLDDEAMVRVLDRGPGVRAEEAARLFEIDYRSPLTEAAATGSGIGLFVARWLAEAMGGRVWAAARPDGGSDFGFALRTMRDQTDDATDDVRPLLRDVEAGS